MHNLDPDVRASTDSLVFASTRGRPGVGPTRSLKYLLPQTDLWRMKSNGAGGYSAPEQMTFAARLGAQPRDDAERRGQLHRREGDADFYQLSGRRMNWDLTDYHPLLAQRAQSTSKSDSDFDPGDATTPSVGYQQATEIREGLDRNFVLILSDEGAKGGGGALATFNRSIGPFEADRTDVTFLHVGGHRRPGRAPGGAGATKGAYRSPFSLPDGRDPGLVRRRRHQSWRAPTPALRAGRSSIRTTGARTASPLRAVPALSYVEAVARLQARDRALFNNLPQLVFGGHAGAPTPARRDHALPRRSGALATLLGANLRTGSFVDKLSGAKQLAVYEDQAPPSDVAAAMAGLAGSQMVYQNRKLLGTVPLADKDHSVRLQLPSMTPLVLELLDGDGGKLFTMAEEDQLGPGERISRGVPQRFFNSVCGGCHGSVSGLELDIALDPDALTGASVSVSRDAPALQVGPSSP